MTAKPSRFDPIVLELRSALDQTVKTMEEAREHESKSRLAFMRAEQHLKEVQRDLVISVAGDLGVQNDPRTGRPNVEWAEHLTEAEVQKDKTWQQAYSDYLNAQAAYQNWSVKLGNSVERLGAIKATARLYASLINLESGA